MRFRKALKTLDTATKEELNLLFERAAYSLGFSSLSRASYEPLDVEASLVLLTYLLPMRELRLARFVGVYLAWLRTYHAYVNTQKLYKMGLLLEKEVGSVPLLHLTAVLMRGLDQKRNSHLVFPDLPAPFYVDPRLKSLVDMKLEEEGFMPGLSPEMNLMVPARGFQHKSTDLVSERELFQRNEQLRMRLLLGVTNRADAVYWLKRCPQMSARELSDVICVSYEPAHRIKKEIMKHDAVAGVEGPRV